MGFGETGRFVRTGRAESTTAGPSRCDEPFFLKTHRKRNRVGNVPIKKYDSWFGFQMGVFDSPACTRNKNHRQPRGRTRS